MTGNQDERATPSALLPAQRRSVLTIIRGLGERDMRRPVAPSGRTPMALAEHLADAGRFWLKQVITGTADPPVTGPARLPPRGRSPEVLAFCREQAQRSDEILAGTPPGSRPAGPLPPEMADEIHTVQDAALHMTGQTARHAGHLDIARELLDGQTGPGPR